MQNDNQPRRPSRMQWILAALVKIDYDGPVRAEPFNKRLNDMPNEQACATTIDAMNKAFALIGG